MAVSAATVADRLRSEATRITTLDALEALAPPIQSDVALAAAPALVDAMATETERASYDRCGLLLARVCAEAAPDPAALYGAAFAGERLEAFLAPTLLVEAAQRASLGQALMSEDARSYACREACGAERGPACVRGLNAPHAAAGRTVIKYMGIVSFSASASHPCCLALTSVAVSVAQAMSVDPIVSPKKMPDDDLPRQMLTLLVDLLRSGGLPELAIGGAWYGVFQCLSGRPGLGPAAMELGLIDLAAEHLRAIGSPADVVSISRGKAGRGHQVLAGGYAVTRLLVGQTERPDLAACVTSGLFDICVEVVVAFAGAGIDGLRDTDHGVVIHTLGWLGRMGSQPGCEAKIRGTATALVFCLENSLEFIEDLGATTGSYAARVCCSVFGRDEGGSEFTFTQEQVDLLTMNWSQQVRAVGVHGARNKPSADTIMALELCISDANKPLLLANKDFIPYLVDALLLDPEHPRAGMKEELKSWCQQHHAECLAQLAVYEPAREALLADPDVVRALRAVAESGLSAKARELAGAALLALSDKKLEMATEGQMHIMLSYQWDHQQTVMRINESLITRGYQTWFDLTNMKGSTMDAMR